ncbi:MAG: ATP-binding protein [Sandaracinus sp.]
MDLLDETSALLVRAADAAGIGVVVLDARATPPETLYVSEVIAQWAGETAAEIARRPAFDYIAPEDRERIAASFEARTADPAHPATMECSILGAGGARIPVSVGIARGLAGGRALQIILLTDVRARNAVAAELSAAERRFRALVETAPDGVVISERLTIRFANRAAATMLGVPEDALAGRSLADFLVPGDVERMGERLRRMHHGEVLAPTVYRARRADGVTVLAEIASMFTEWSGRPMVLAMVRDVTAREALQASLERTERLAALGRLAAGMAHEINNPLAFVALSAEALARRLEPLVAGTDDGEEILSLLDNVSRGTARVSAIVRDLKAFSRDGENERAPVDLEQVLSSAVRMVQHEIAPRARLTRETQGMPVVLGSAGKLEQVFVNLLMNAVQALPERRIGHIVVRAFADATHAHVQIKDDGVGIPAENVHRAFDPFFTTKPVGVGTGLGLSICHGIVTATGGAIRIESEEGRGTTVHVSLPRAVTGTVTAGSAAAGPTAAERSHILVVEDQAPLARTLAKALGERHQVTVAIGVREAIAALDTHGLSFDVVLCDMLMPDGTGMDVFEHACAGPSGLSDRFVFMTGGAFLPSLAAFLERVPNPRIDKPFGLPALETLLEQVARAQST